jgi:hypothetical protein
MLSLQLTSQKLSKQFCLSQTRTTWDYQDPSSVVLELWGATPKGARGACKGGAAYFPTDKN